MGVISGGGSGAGGEDSGGHSTNLSPSLQMVVVMLADQQGRLQRMAAVQRRTGIAAERSPRTESAQRLRLLLLSTYLTNTRGKNTPALIVLVVGEGKVHCRSVVSVMVGRERIDSLGQCLKRDYDSSPE